MAVFVKASIPLEEWVRDLYDKFGQRKPMGQSAPNARTPHYFLHRTFLGENDLLIIFNTKRCRYRCHFCQLPQKSSKVFIPGKDILAQFKYVLKEMKHSLSVLDRLTLSNEGSILDNDTFPADTLLTIARCIPQLRRVRTFVIETLIEFVDSSVIYQIKKAAPKVVVDILTGFETYEPHIRDEVLVKNESLSDFEAGLDKVAESGATFSSYILFKPGPTMTDEEAFIEAEKSIDYVVDQCQCRGITLNYIRINPMYAAKGSPWAKIAKATPKYQPPRLTDVMRLAEKKAKEGLKIYIGLSTESLDEVGCNYMSREDYSPALIKPIKLFNDCKISSFGG